MHFSSYRRQYSNLAVTRILSQVCLTNHFIFSGDQTALFGVKMLKPDVDSAHRQIEYQETVPSGTQRINVFRVILTVNSHYFPAHH